MAARGDAAIGNGLVAKAIFANAIAFFNVVEDRKNDARLGIEVIVEKLCFRLIGVPIQHGPLLQVPCQGLVDDSDLVIILRIQQYDVACFALDWHSFVEVRLE